MSKYIAQPRDDHGARKGTVASKVNSALSSGKWMTVDEVAKKARITRTSAQHRLQYGRLAGLYEYERSIRFKLKRKKK